LKKLLALFIVLSLCYGSFSQRLTSTNVHLLEKKQDSLKKLANMIMDGRNVENVMDADSMFTRVLVRALKVDNSFYYPFDSLKTISKLIPPDSSFRIFTWQMVLSEDLVRQHGAIQMRTKDGSLKLFPLIDRSDVVDDMADTVADNLGWMGAIYYRIIQKEAYGKKFYTLLGYDENNMKSNKKVIEVLTFPEGKPLFGGPYFSFPDNSISKKFQNRYVMEYKKHAGPRLAWDEEQDMIMVEHLISETNEPQKKYTYIPDGDYEGLRWTGGKWVHINKVYTFKLNNGEAPVPQPLGEQDLMPDDKNNVETGDAPKKVKVKKKSKG
jgi:hypothetical protein